MQLLKALGKFYPALFFDCVLSFARFYPVTVFVYIHSKSPIPNTMSLPQTLLQQQISAHCNKTLADSANGNLLNKNSLDQSFEFNLGNTFALTAGATASASVQVYNTTESCAGDALAQQLKLTDLLANNAIIKYDLTGQITASGETPLGNLGFDLDQTLTLSSYRLHQPAEELCAAVAADAGSFKLLLVKNHIQTLAVNEALNMSVRGNLGFKAKAKWGDVLTAGMPAIVKSLLPSDTTLVTVNAGLEVSASFQVEDDFEVVVQRTGQDAFLVSINKTIKSELNVAGGFNVSVELSDDEGIQALVASLVNRAEQGLYQKVVPLLQQGADKLTDAQLALLKRIAGALGLPTTREDAEALQQQVNDKIKEWTAKIQEAVTSTLQVGATYSYQKNKTDQTVFAATFTAAAIAQHHGHIIGLKAGHIIDAYVAGQPGITLREYQRLVQVNITSAFKIGFKLGKLTLSQKKEKTFDRVEHYQVVNRKKQMQISEYNQGVSMSIVEGDNTFDTAVDLNAKMNGYVETASQALASLFNYEFTVQWAVTDNKTKDHELINYVDRALAWGIIKEADFDSTVQHLQSTLGQKPKGVHYTAYIKAPYQVFDQLIDALAGLNDLQLAQSMAAVTAYAPYPGRQALSQRQEQYREVWQLYLSQTAAQVDPKSLAIQLSNHFGGKGLDEVANFEGNLFNGTRHGYYDRHALPNMIQYNIIGDRVHDCLQGFKELQAGWQHPYDDVLRKAFKNHISGVLIQKEFNNRLLGRLVLDAAESLNLTNQLQRAFTITYTDRNSKTEQKIIYS